MSDRIGGRFGGGLSGILRGPGVRTGELERLPSYCGVGLEGSKCQLVCRIRSKQIVIFIITVNGESGSGTCGSTSGQIWLGVVLMSHVGFKLAGFESGG